MDNPYGLGIKDNLLFICDGTSGLKVYNKANIEELELLNTFKDITAYDVIPMENNLLLINKPIINYFLQVGIPDNLPVDFFILLDGVPTYTPLSNIFLTTTVPAPIITSSFNIFVPAEIIEPLPKKQ